MKIKRDAFLYMENPATDDFAQCSSCWLYARESRKCMILGSDLDVGPDDTCAYYLEGKEAPLETFVEHATPEEVGFIRATQVRCENCDFGDDGTCGLYRRLNSELPGVFDLDEEIDARGCCNGWVGDAG